MDDDDDDVPTCPLCLEELDATDRAVKACQCGYQVCLWCLHHIREQLSARCPACRTPYEEQNFKFAEVNPEQAAKEAKERATAKKERERKEKLKEIERERARAVAVSQQKAKSNLKHARILQKNLVYVIGLSLTLAREEVIRRADMFGKFGRMVRILVNRAHPFNADAPGGPSISAYVQYYRDSDASAAVRSMNNAVFDGREIRCAIATTKYCDVFVRSGAASDQNALFHCGNQHCMYYHSISPPEAVLSREEVLARQLGPPPPAHLFLPESRRPHPIPSHFHRTGPPQPLPMTSAPNTSVSAAVSAVPASRSLSTRAPATASSMAMSSVTFNANNQVTNTNVSSNPNAPSSVAIPTDASAGLASIALGQQQIASSARARALAGPGSGRRTGVQPQASSPSPSPQRTPPSSPGRRRSVPRLNRSPGMPDPAASSSMASGTGALSGSGMGSATASAAPFFSPPFSSAQLPSTAGWGSGHSGSSSRSPPRRSPSTSLDDPSRSRSRVQLRRLRDNAPPGFEGAIVPNAPSAPSRPPGFDNPPSNQSISRLQVGSEVKPTAPPVTAVSAPPGFGPGPVASRDSGAEDSGRNDVAAAWSQEASSDEVFSTNDRRSKRPVGQPSQRSGVIAQGDIDSRAELAQVLAKIGGDLGVSSEFQYVKTGPLPLGETAEHAGRQIGGTGESRTPRPQLGSLFGNQSFHGSPQSPIHGSAVSVPFARASAPSVRPKVGATPRRNNSRFDFARMDVPERSGRALDESVQTPQLVATTSLEVNTSSRTGNELDTSIDANGVRSEGRPMSERARIVTQHHSTVTSVPQVARQSRSRFDFADHASSPPKFQHFNQTVLHQTRHSDAVVKGDPVGDAFGETFASLSTAEKLASIFNSAQWSAERLPPMPAYDAQVDQVTIQRPNSAAVTQTNGRASNTPSNALNTSSPDEDRSRASVPRDHPIQFAPPGFREATPGIAPETTAVDNTLTTAGVATNVASGGATIETSEGMSSMHFDESVSSGTESLEEDRKRSRAQRKRDKKARQLREAAERKAMEALSLRSMPAQNVDVPANVKDQRVLAPTGGLREIRNPSPGQILSQPKEPSKQLKPTRLADDPSTFMSVSELEREVEAAKAREAQLQDRLQELQRRIRSYDNVRT